jgi:hypothetical protein
MWHKTCTYSLLSQHTYSYVCIHSFNFIIKSIIIYLFVQMKFFILLFSIFSPISSFFFVKFLILKNTNIHTTKHKRREEWGKSEKHRSTQIRTNFAWKILWFVIMCLEMVKLGLFLFKKRSNDKMDKLVQRMCGWIDVEWMGEWMDRGMLDEWMDECWMNEWMDEYILCECVLEKNKLLMIFGGQHNVGTIPLSIAKRTIVQLTIRAAWVQSSLWEGKRDSPMICWKGGEVRLLYTTT